MGLPTTHGDGRPEPTRAALTAATRTSTSPDWGTHPLVRTFAACVLAPASRPPNSIDVDVASSAYWQSQWPDDERPASFLSEERSALDVTNWGQAQSGFCNAPGDAQGANVHAFWEMSMRRLRSLFWVAFNLEQLRSLQSHELHPLSRDPRVTTFVPSRRLPYLVRPSVMVQILEAKLPRAKTMAQADAMQREIVSLRSLPTDDAVFGGSPTHASALVVVWDELPSIKAMQVAAAGAFLREQATDPRSPLRSTAVLGETEVL